MLPEAISVDSFAKVRYVPDLSLRSEFGRSTLSWTVTRAGVGRMHQSPIRGATMPSVKPAAREAVIARRSIRKNHHSAHRLETLERRRLLSAIDVLTQHNDNNRTSENLSETVLNTTN